jgi:hypothetical protein
MCPSCNNGSECYNNKELDKLAESCYVAKVKLVFSFKI